MSTHHVLHQISRKEEKKRTEGIVSLAGIRCDAQAGAQLKAGNGN
jgi:hypothetical protein